MFEVIGSTEKTKWRLTELIQALIKLADLNAKFRLDIYDQTLFSLKQIVFNGNEVEKEYALKLLWKFCFSEDLLNEIRQDLDLTSFLLGLTANKLNKSVNVMKYAEMVIYALKLEDTEHIVIKIQTKLDSVEGEESGTFRL